MVMWKSQTLDSPKRIFKPILEELKACAEQRNIYHQKSLRKRVTAKHPTGGALVLWFAKCWSVSRHFIRQIVRGFTAQSVTKTQSWTILSCRLQPVISFRNFWRKTLNRGWDQDQLSLRKSKLIRGFRMLIGTTSLTSERGRHTRHFWSQKAIWSISRPNSRTKHFRHRQSRWKKRSELAKMTHTQGSTTRTKRCRLTIITKMARKRWRHRDKFANLEFVIVLLLFII